MLLPESRQKLFKKEVRMMNEIDFEVFDESYRGAKMYHYRAEQFLEEGQHYSVVFNVASVALENYYHGGANEHLSGRRVPVA